MLRQRIITASVLIPVVVAAILFFDRLWFGVAFGIIAALGAWEWARLSGIQNGLAVSAYVFLVTSLMGICFVYINQPWIETIILLAVMWWLLVLILIITVQKQALSLPASRPLKLLAGLLVLIPAWLSLLLLRESWSVARELVLYLFILIWLADSAAYFTGRRFGKTRLCSRISPGKTVAGVYGALFSSIVLALGYALVNNVQGIEITIFIIICLITVLMSVIGDLMVSMMKRAANLKDSGQLLPGHGGVLDRIDSLTAAAPVFYAGLWFWGNGR